MSEINFLEPVIIICLAHGPKKTPASVENNQIKDRGYILIMKCKFLIKRQILHLKRLNRIQLHLTGGNFPLKH